MKRLVGIIALAAASVVLLGEPSGIDACVGKTIYLGRLPGKEQEILAEMFVWLVSERTGTSIEVKPVADSRAGHSSLQEASIDLYLEETVVALRDILGQDLPAGGGEEARQIVRREYEERFNLVWLEPWGLEGKKGGALPSKIAPVVRRDTLKKFPALSRLVNKMAGVVDDRTMEQLLAESSTRPVREVTKKFLKEKKLI